MRTKGKKLDYSQVEDFRPGHINAANRRQQREQGSVNVARNVGSAVGRVARNVDFMTQFRVKHPTPKTKVTRRK